MKLYIVFLSSVFMSAYASKHFTGHSYYNTEPLHFLSVIKDKVYKGGSERNEYSLEVVQGSTGFISSYNSQELRYYFSPFEKKELRVKEAVDANLNPLIDQGAQDILGYNFNLVTQEGKFESIVSFKPTKRVWFSELALEIKLKDSWWMNVLVPFLYMRTNMNMEETILEKSGGASTDLTNFHFNGVAPVGSLKEAFACKDMKYGRIDKARSKVGFSDLVIRLGTEYTSSDKKGLIRPYIGIILPTSNKPQAEYMFEPILGNGKHAGFLTGAQWSYNVRDCKEWKFVVNGITQMSYLLPNHQMRSFDPGGKPWGRYLAMFSNESDMTPMHYTFGINECTYKAKVHPGAHFTSNIVIKGLHEKYTVQCGYQTTLRTSQRVLIPSNWKTPAIASIGEMEAKTNPARGINNLLDGFTYDTYHGIQKDEVSDQTVSHPWYIAHQFMASFTRNVCCKNRVYTMELGTTLSYGSTNAVPREWSLYGSITYAL